VLGTGTQTARAAIEQGAIGRPTAANAVMMTAGHERWHSNPAFYYKPGGGPLLDMAPYYISSLVHLLGPIRSVIGASSRPRSTRTVAVGPFAGQTIDVEVETHVTGILEHADGALSTLTTSFEGTRTSAAPIEVHGQAGSLTVPDPNIFGGDVRVIAVNEPEWRDVPTSAGYVDAARGVGLIDFATATASRPARAGGDLALHVLDTMQSLLLSAREGRRIDLTTTAARPEPVALTAAETWQSLAAESDERDARGVRS
jgi:predicted dehydrogenase